MNGAVFIETSSHLNHAEAEFNKKSGRNGKNTTNETFAIRVPPGCCRHSRQEYPPLEQALLEPQSLHNCPPES
ncbi:MAG TPA: hypothetical protein VL475_13695 [Planctomycetaceae bacterium]|nr:hypothetical protein [Planctomycetaceae bacterium]